MVQDRIGAALKAMKGGSMVVVMDDDDRENEGDLIMAASQATAETIAFMIRHTSGILCAPLPDDYADRFDLPPMVRNNTAPLSTPFTVSVDFAPGLTTGISADERCATVRALASHNSAAQDFVRPGHIFPLRARDGGVLFRAGHTEAAVDLARMAGLPPVGVLAELVNDDGTVKKGAEVTAFAAEHGLPMLTIDELIAHRQKREKLVRRTATVERDMALGPATIHTYRTIFDEAEHLAIVFGDPSRADFVPTRIHRESIIADVFGPTHLIDSIKPAFKKAGCAVLLYLRAGGVGVVSESVSDQLSHAAGEVEGEGADSRRTRERVWKELGLGAQILGDLDIARIDLITAKPRRYIGLQGFGIELKS